MEKNAVYKHFNIDKWAVRDNFAVRECQRQNYSFLEEVLVE